jgi:hypothetical protein
MLENWGLTELAAEAESAIVRYYSSGQARKDFDQIELKSASESWRRYGLTEITANAPPEFRTEFGNPPPRNVLQIIQDETITGAQKEQEIQQAIGFELRGNEIQQMQLTNSLGQLAGFNRELALRIREQMADDTLQFWADTIIAVELSAREPAESRQRIREAYLRLKTIRYQGDQDILAYNYPLPLLGAVGLRAVELVAPEDLPVAIKTVMEVAPELLTSTLADARANYFELVAAVARYDREAAQILFDRAGNNVDLHSAASYFVALAALAPERILKEYEEIPFAPNNRGTTYRPYICNSIIPALCASGDDDFWDSLAAHSHLKIEVPRQK